MQLDSVMPSPVNVSVYSQERSIFLYMIDRRLIPQKKIAQLPCTISVHETIKRKTLWGKVGTT